MFEPNQKVILKGATAKQDIHGCTVDHEITEDERGYREGLAGVARPIFPAAQFDTWVLVNLPLAPVSVWRGVGAHQRWVRGDLLEAEWKD